MLEMVKNSNFLPPPPLWKPFGQPRWLNARMCAGLCPTYATTLDDARENRNSRRLIIPKNWYYVAYFLNHPVEPRGRWVHTHATV